jgi:putative membrane protein
MARNMALLAATALFVFAAPASSHDNGITDAQIAHIAYTAGALDVETARLALERSRNPQVRAFAETMVRDHEAVNRQAVELLQRLGVTPAAHPTSAALSTDSASERQRLAALQGQDFDRAYAAREAAYHAAVNEALRTTLIPAAHNAELKGLLESGLALFSAHQEHAEMLVRQLR